MLPLYSAEASSESKRLSFPRRNVWWLSANCAHLLAKRRWLQKSCQEKCASRARGRRCPAEVSSVHFFISCCAFEDVKPHLSSPLTSPAYFDHSPSFFSIMLTCSGHFGWAPARWKRGKGLDQLATQGFPWTAPSRLTQHGILERLGSSATLIVVAIPIVGVPIGIVGVPNINNAHIITYNESYIYTICLFNIM